MGWRFKWLSSGGTDFNYDYQASFRPEDLRSGKAIYNYVATDPGHPDREGVSVFYKDARGGLFHTYSSYARGEVHVFPESMRGAGEGHRSWDLMVVGKDGAIPPM